MTQVEVLSTDRDRAGAYKVDLGRSERIGRVSSKWFSRPADERYPSLSDLYAAVHDLALGQVAAHVVDSRDPVSRRASHAHLDPAIIELGSVQACRKGAALVVNAKAFEIRVVLADTLNSRIDHSLERGVAYGRIPVIPARMQVKVHPTIPSSSGENSPGWHVNRVSWSHA